MWSSLALGWLLGCPVFFSLPAPQQPASVRLDSPEVHVGRGYELVKDQRYGEAAKEFQVALALNPTLVRARYQLAVCLFALGERSDSRKEFERLRAETSNDPNVIYYLGRLDLVEGDIESAIRHLSAVAGRPPFPDTAYYLGTAYLKKGDFREGEAWLARAARADPRDFRVHEQLARLYHKIGRTSDAEKEYAFSAKLREHYNEASRQAMACAEALENRSLEEARAPCHELDQAEDADKLMLLAMLYGQHGDFADALAPLERAAQLDPDSYEVQHNLGLTYFRLRRYAEARAPLERAVALRPDFFGSNALLGAVLFVLAEDEAAYKRLGHAHRLNPQDEDTALQLFKVAVVLGGKKFAGGEYGLCLEYLQEAVQLRPADAEVHRHLAEAYGKLGRSSEAERERRKADRLARPRG